MSPATNPRANSMRSLVAMLAVLMTLVLVTILPAATGDTVADHELGQPDFLHNLADTVNRGSLDVPEFVAVDRTGDHLYLSDTMNNRVLGWRNIAAFVNDQPADLVLGQPDLFSNLKNGSGGTTVGPLKYSAPTGVAVDSQGNLYVSDTGNNRVLAYDTPFSSCASFPCAGRAPIAIFGQLGNYAADGCNLGAVSVAASADSLCSPQGLAVDAHDNLYIADDQNSRVLEFNTPLTTTMVAGSGDTTADLVFGQGTTGANFTTDNCNNSLSVTANYLCNAQAVGVDPSGNVYISDTGNSRVLEYNEATTPPANVSPSLVFGQSGFTTGTCGGASATGLCFPLQLSFDSASNLYIADARSNRVLEYNTPLTVTSTPGSGDTTADLALGVPSVSSVGNCSSGHPVASTTMCAPAGVDLDDSGDVIVADTADNRVMVFDTPLTTNTAADVVLGQPDFSHTMANTVGPWTLSSPRDAALDLGSTPNHLYVADQANSRVLGWNNATSFANGAPADLVLGQPDFYTSSSNTGGESLSTMAGPYGVAVDGSGNLYVSDSSNNRVLEFSAPFTACANTFPCVGGAAAHVYGLTGTSTESCAGTASATTLCTPKGVALDLNGDLYVADYADSRVLEYTSPLTNTTADLVFGQGTSPTFATTTCNGPSSTESATTLCFPAAVAADASGNIYIADSNNDRVLVYNEASLPPSNITANAVFGQGGSFTTRGCNALNAGTLCNPQQIAFDSTGNAYIADDTESRVLEYNTPLTTTAVPGSGDTNADRVFGQADDMGTGACNFGDQTAPAASTLCGPIGVALDTVGDLFVVDANNNRILKYDQPLTIPATPTPTATSTAATPTATATATATRSATATATATSSHTATPTPTSTRTVTPTATSTSTRTATPTQTPTGGTPTVTPTATPTQMGGPTATPTPLPEKLTVAPQTLAFGSSTTVGKASKPKTVTIKNAGSKKTGLPVNITMETASPPVFSIKSECEKTLKPGASCKVSVTFSPTDTTAQSGSLMIDDNVAGAPQIVGLTGTGKAAKQKK